MAPYFSIIIPMYNRENFILRSITSCLKQDFEDFEIIVVDDGSVDGSVNVVKRILDSRIRLICHTVNRGVGPARNTGVDAATGEWVICFDSDDELFPGALSTIYKRSTQIDNCISRLQFMVQMDTGELSPDPPLIDEFWDYTRYMQWMEKTYGHRSETLPIVRRNTFKKVRYYNDRTLEGPYHLDFMKHFDAWSFPDVVRLYHHDAENQLTRQSVEDVFKGSLTQAVSGERLLKEHGDALKIYAPHIYLQQISNLATLWFISGNRMKGVEFSLLSIKIKFLSVRNWVVFLIGLMGSKPIAWMKFYRTHYVNVIKKTQ